MVALLYWWYRRRLRHAREIPYTHAPMPPSNESLADSWPAHALGGSAPRAEELSVESRPISREQPHAMPPSFCRAAAA
jgi:hypothetical protein